MWLCYVSFNVINTYRVHFSGSWKPSKGTYFVGYALHPIEIPPNTVFQRGESCPRLESFKPSLLPCTGNGTAMFLLQLSLLYHYLHGTTTQPRHDTQQQSNNHRIVLCFSTNPSTFCIVIQIERSWVPCTMKQPISNNRCVVLEGNLIACNSCSLAPSLSISHCLHLFSPSIFVYLFVSLFLSGCLMDSFHFCLSPSNLSFYHFKCVLPPPQTPPLTHFPTPWLACFPLFPRSMIYPAIFCPNHSPTPLPSLQGEILVSTPQIQATPC